MTTDAVDVRTQGDATDDQRTELKELLESKVYPKEWRDQLYADVRAAGGLSNARATSVLNWLRDQPNLDGSPIHADADQLDEIQTLLRSRLAPGPWAKQIRVRIAAGTMTSTEAVRYLSDLQRLPKKVFVAPTGLRMVGDAPIGYFALNDDGKVRCYRIHTDRHGELLVEIFTSDHSLRRRTLGQRRAAPVLDAIAADPAAAGRLFAVTRKHCCACNQPLQRTDQPGFPHGLGEDCWNNRQAAATNPGKV